MDEAWSAYVAMVHGDKPVQKEQYHQERLAFCCGIVASINLLSTLFQDDNREVHDVQKMGEHLGNVMVEAMNRAMAEYQEVKK